MPDLAHLTIQPDQDPGPRAVPRRIEIIDSRFGLAGKGFGTHTAELPAGLYCVRVESAEAPFERVVCLNPGVREKIVYPDGAAEQLCSPAPVPGSHSMHEYFRRPLGNLAGPDRPCPTRARLVVMFTRQDKYGSYNPINLRSCHLWNARGKQVVNFESDVNRGEPAHLWAGLSLDLLPGGYLLDWPTLDSDSSPKPCVRQPLWVARNYCTLLFMPVSAGMDTPTPAHISIHYSRLNKDFVPELSGFNEDNPINRGQRASELALHSLAGGRLLLSLDEIDRHLLQTKFENPMLGLLGAHLLLDRPPEQRRWLDVVLRNLDRLLPGHPDVAALRVRAGKRPRRVAWPPMFRAGYTALREADWEVPGTFPPGSLVDHVRVRVRSGGVWTRWLDDPGFGEWRPPVATRSSPTKKQAPAHKKIVAFKGSVGSKQKTFAPAKAAVATTRRKQAATVRKKPPIAALAEALGPVDRLVAEQIQRFIRQAKSTGRRVLRAADLRWTGLSAAQAKIALRLLQ